MPASSAPVFDAHAAAYDAMRRRFIPCFDAFYGTALRLIADWLTGDSFASSISGREPASSR